MWASRTTSTGSGPSTSGATCPPRPPWRSPAWPPIRAASWRSAPSPWRTSNGAPGRGPAAMSVLGFVGLGAMGSRLARRLLAAGHAVTGWNRTEDKARNLVGAGLVVAKSPRAAAEGAEGVFIMVTDDAALRAVALGPDGVVAGLGAG